MELCCRQTISAPIIETIFAVSMWQMYVAKSGVGNRRNIFPRRNFFRKNDLAQVQSQVEGQRPLMADAHPKMLVITHCRFVHFYLRFNRITPFSFFLEFLNLNIFFTFCTNRNFYRSSILFSFFG